MTTASERTVMTLIIDKDGKLLLSRRLNTWFGDKQFAPPGGLVDTGEDPKNAAIRECQEEVGLTVGNLKLLEEKSTIENGRSFHNHYYLTGSYSGTILNQEPERHSELGWHPINNLPQDTMPLVRDIVERHLL